MSPERRQHMSESMKAAWRDGKFTGTTFSGRETKLEKTVRELFDRCGVAYKQYFWVHIKHFRPKQYDFYLPAIHTLVEVDGEYWHSLPCNVDNDQYKLTLALAAGYNLVRVPERLVKGDERVLFEEVFRWFEPQET